MQNSKKIWVAMIAILIIAVGGYFYPRINSAFGASLPTDGTVSRTLGTIYSYTNGLNGIQAGIWSDGVLAVKSYLQFNSGIDATSAATSTSYFETATVGSCPTLGTSTLAIVPNPFAATSTASLSFYGAGQATSTSVWVGTTTVATTGSLALSDVSPSLASGAVIATTTQANFLSGGTAGLGTGQVTAGTGSTIRVIVGPSEKIGFYATSTYGTTGSVNYNPGLTSCQYKLKWTY